MKVFGRDLREFSLRELLRERAAKGETLADKLKDMRDGNVEPLETRAQLIFLISLARLQRATSTRPTMEAIGKEMEALAGDMAHMDTRVRNEVVGNLITRQFVEKEYEKITGGTFNLTSEGKKALTTVCTRKAIFDHPMIQGIVPIPAHALRP